MGRDTIQLETAVSTISQEYLLEFTSEYGISEDLHPELPAPGDRIVDFLEDKIDEKVFLTVVDWRESAPKDEKPAEGSYFVEDVARLDTCCTPIQKQPEALLCLVGLSRRYYLGDDVYPTFLYDDGREMDLFNLISASNPAKVKTGTHPRAAHEGDGTEDQVLETGASEVPRPGYVSTTGLAPNIVVEEEDAADVPVVSKRRHKRVNDGADANAPPKVLRKDFDVSRPTSSTFEGKSFAATGLEAGSTLSVPASQRTPAGTIDSDPLSFTEPQPAPAQDIAESTKGATIAGDLDSEKSSSITSFAGSPGGVYQPGWGITNSCRFNTPGACQDAVRLLKKAKEKVAKRDQRIHTREEEIKKLDQEVQGLRNQTKNLETLLEAEVSILEAQVTGEEQIKAAFEEFKKCEEDKVERCYAEMDARLDALSIDFDEELIAKGMSEGLKHGVEHGKAQLDLGVIEAYDPEADAKYVAALHALKDVEYPLIDHLEKLKDAPIDLIMASLHLKSDVGEETP
ncbi:hypothetical protein Tco_0110412 [Tanacetum coccineum]